MPPFHFFLISFILRMSFTSCCQCSMFLGTSDLDEIKLKEKARSFHDSFLTKVLT